MHNHPLVQELLNEIIQIITLTICNYQIQFTSDKNLMKKVNLSSIELQNFFGFIGHLKKKTLQLLLFKEELQCFCFSLHLAKTSTINKVIKMLLASFLYLAKDCLALFQTGQTCSGVYTIYPTGSAKTDVVCDMEKMGGGWTVSFFFTKTHKPQH